MQVAQAEGENVAIVYRFADNHDDRLPELAADLARRRVAVISTAGTPSVLAAKGATTTIPIVFLVGDDPVRLNLVTSLARPDGNMTGINVSNSEVTAKRLEFLRVLVPHLARIAVLVNPADRMLTKTQLKGVDAVAHATGLRVEVFNADTSAEIDAAFDTMGRERPDAVLVGATAFLNGRSVQLAHLASFHRLPAIYGLRDFAEAGGLISYGSDIVNGFRQVGHYTGLRGTKPADLPVVQANKFELVINAQTARMFGLAVPDQLLAVADDVIE